MKVQVRKVNSVVQNAGKQIEHEISAKSKQTDDKYLTNVMDSFASSAKAGLGLSKVTKEKVLSKRTEIADGVREYIENCKDGSIELEAIDNLLAMVESGRRLSPKVLEGFGKESKLPENLVKDLIKTGKSDKNIQKLVPVLNSEAEALKKMKTGDVFQIKGDDCVSIKNRKGEVEKLSMTRKHYYDMFRPVDRYASVQSDFGNCYEVTALNAMMDNPQTRENLLRCIDTKTKPGYIRVKLPNSVLDSPIEMAFAPKSYYYMDGAKGFNVIEYALGKEYAAELVKNKLNELQKQGKDSTMVNLRHMFENNEERKLVNFFDAPDKELPLSVNLRDGGVALVPWAKLGLEKNKIIVNAEKDVANTSKRKSKNVDKDKADKFKEFLEDKYVNESAVYSPEEFAECLWTPEFFEKNLVEASFLKDSPLLGLKKGHSYYLKPVLDENGKIESYLIKDPHGVAEMPLSFEDATNKIDVISFAQI